MAYLDATHLAADPRRTAGATIGTPFSLGLSAALPLVAALATSWLVATAGLGALAPLYADPLAMLVYLPLFAMWGAAHGLAARAGGDAAARWVLAVIGWGLAYPFLAGIADAFWLGWINLASLLLVAATALRLAPVSRPALLLVLPSLVWVALAAIPGYVLLTNGWSPGFAVAIGTLDEGAGD